MARPTKNADEKRSKWIKARLTIAERETVRSNAAKAGFAGDESEYIRRRVVDLSMPDNTLTAADPALIAALNNYAVSLSKIGNNVNQLAHQSHLGRNVTNRLSAISDELEDELKAARTKLNRLLSEADG